MPMEIRQRNEKTKAVTVGGILLPRAIKRAIINLVVPKSKTCIRIGILAFLNEAKHSLILEGYFRLQIIIAITIMTPTDKIKNPTLNKKLTI